MIALCCIFILFGILLIVMPHIIRKSVVYKRKTDKLNRKKYNNKIKEMIGQHRNVVKIEFDRFKNFYNISPKKYDFSNLKYGMYVSYFPKEHYESYEDFEDYFLVFSYKDYKKALKFEENNKIEEYTINYLNNVQNDIEECKGQAKSYVDESLEIVNKVKQERKSRCG